MSNMLIYSLLNIYANNTDIESKLFIQQLATLLFFAIICYLAVTIKYIFKSVTVSFSHKK